MQGSFGSYRQIDHHIDDSVRLYYNNEPDDYPSHWHSAAELIMPVENTYTLLVSDVTYHVAPGELFMVPPGVVHEIFAPESGARYIFMLDQKEFYAVEGLGEAQHVLYPCVHLSLDEDPALLDETAGFFRNAVFAYDRKAEMGPAEMRLWLRLVLVRMVQVMLHKTRDSSSEANALRSQTVTVMVRSCAYISEHCMEKLTLDDVAAFSGYSKYHFSRVFKTFTGMSFYDYYMRQRLVLCRRLLSDSTMQVTEVALRVGFDSITTFNRVFKQFEGMTPSCYRRLKQNTQQELRIKNGDGAHSVGD